MNRARQGARLLLRLVALAGNFLVLLSGILLAFALDSPASAVVALGAIGFTVLNARSLFPWPLRHDDPGVVDLRRAALLIDQVLAVLLLLGSGWLAAAGSATEVGPGVGLWAALVAALDAAALATLPRRR